MNESIHYAIAICKFRIRKAECTRRLAQINKLLRYFRVTEKSYKGSRIEKVTRGLVISSAERSRDRKQYLHNIQRWHIYDKRPSVPNLVYPVYSKGKFKNRKVTPPHHYEFYVGPLNFNLQTNTEA